MPDAKISALHARSCAIRDDVEEDASKRLGPRGDRSLLQVVDIRSRGDLLLSWCEGRTTWVFSILRIGFLDYFG